MDLLKHLASSSRATTSARPSDAAAAASTSAGGAAPRKRYMRRGEQRAEAAAAVAAVAKATAQRPARTGDDGSAMAAGADSGSGPAAAAAAAGSGSGAGKRAGDASGDDAKATEGTVGEGNGGGAGLPYEEVTKRLRRLGQPITLFGEDADARLARLRRKEGELGASALDSDLLLGEGHEIGNPFLAQDDKSRAALIAQLGLDESDDDDDDEDGGGDSSAGRHSAKRRRTDDSGGVDGDEARGSSTGADRRGTAFGTRLVGRDGKELAAHMYVYRFFKQLLRLWEADLASRSDSAKGSTQGSLAALTHKQCKDYMRPFFKMLKANQLAADILAKVRLIVEHLESREYVKASDVYVKLAIGNAPWPIGVTSVGIHERAARTKIFANNVAHVLNDERQRKYITSVKRLMTYCQNKYPTDPSKMLL